MENNQNVIGIDEIIESLESLDNAKVERILEDLKRLKQQNVSTITLNYYEEICCKIFD